MINKKYIQKNYDFDAVNSVIEALYDELVFVDDQKLLDLAFAKKIEQSQLDKFLKDFNIKTTFYNPHEINF